MGNSKAIADCRSQIAEEEYEKMSAIASRQLTGRIMLLRHSVMHSSAQCARCEGTGRCPDCNGTGTNRHLNSADPRCPECSATGICGECDGGGKSPIAMPLYQGSPLKQGLLWAGVVIAVWWAISLLNKSRFYAVVGVLIWTVSWCAVLYRNAKRHESRKESASLPHR